MKTLAPREGGKLSAKQKRYYLKMLIGASRSVRIGHLCAIRRIDVGSYQWLKKRLLAINPQYNQNFVVLAFTPDPGLTGIFFLICFFHASTLP